MNIGEINKGAIALILVLLVGAGGFLWYSQMYKPAVALKTTAAATASTAEQGLATANTELAAAQKRIEDSRNENAKPDDSVSRLAVATASVPPDELLDDAAIVLGDMAERSGVDTRFRAGESDDVGSSSDAPSSNTNLQGAAPIDMEFEAAGTYAEMMEFMRLVESSVEMDDSKLYSRGRLFNVVRLEIGEEEKDASQGNFGDLDGAEGQEPDTDALVVGKNDDLFKVTVRMYTSSTANAQGVGSTPDPAAAATTGTGTGADAAAGTTPAAGTTGGTPAAGTPAADGSTDGATAIPATAETQTPAGAAAGGS